MSLQPLEYLFDILLLKFMHGHLPHSSFILLFVYITAESVQHLFGLINFDFIYRFPFSPLLFILLSKSQEHSPLHFHCPLGFELVQDLFLQEF